MIAENRTELMTLTATNLLRAKHAGDRGQSGRWPDVGPRRGGDVWLRHHGGDGDRALLPFETPTDPTNPGGLLEQAVPVEEAIDTAAANQLMNNVPQARCNSWPSQRRASYLLQAGWAGRRGLAASVAA
ncbi:hypothetical protein ABLN96_20525 [Mycobacterium tuberculosis]|uniref:hypothetical protein n=1 Tax=Mycobacterium tuberculosis TaxID=1773 RepID=UPI0032B53679